MFENASCAGKPTEWWYPVREGKNTEQLSEIFHNMKAALSLCKTCPACLPCLDYSLNNNEIGIWGGMGERTRKTARRMVKAGVPLSEIMQELVTGYDE